MAFGQVVIGPPGSGRTTYCTGLSQLLQLTGRKVAVLNLDPANDRLPYECAVNIEEFVKLEDVMVQHELGPNGGLVYSMDYLSKNLDWLQAKLQPLAKELPRSRNRTSLVKRKWSLMSEDGPTLSSGLFSVLRMRSDINVKRKRSLISEDEFLPVVTVPPEERFLFRRIGPKQYCMYRCAVRYG